MLQLGYTTYGMRDEDPFDALPRLREIGYEAIELTVSEGWPTHPGCFDQGDRRELVALCRELSFPPPHLMTTSIAPLAENRSSTLSQFRSACELARDLHFGDGKAVIKMPMTGEQPAWEGNEELIADRLLELADIADEHDVVFAAEPHVGTCFETPDKAAWLMDNTDHRALQLAFDISHFPTDLFDIERAVRLVAPHTATTHVKDTEVVDGEFRFLLPGEGDFDYEAYFRMLVDYGYEGPIIAEVSRQLWGRPEHDHWEAARTMCDNLLGPVTAANEYATGEEID